MKIFIFSILFSIIPLPNLAKGFISYNFTGLIGNKLEVAIHLEKKGNQLSGFYYYENSGIDIQLKGTIKEDKVELLEFDFRGNPAATIQGKFTEHGFVGEWKSLSIESVFLVNLELIKYNIPPLPNKIEGTYIMRDAVRGDGCYIEVEIKKKKGKYIYTLQINEKKYEGEVYFSRLIKSEAPELYIVFPEIEWAENLGNISDELDEAPIEEILSEGSSGTYGLDCYCSDEGLIFQNYGNAMNYYVKIAECDYKYIELIRK